MVFLFHYIKNKHTVQTDWERFLGIDTDTPKHFRKCPTQQSQHVPDVAKCAHSACYATYNFQSQLVSRSFAETRHYDYPDDCCKAWKNVSARAASKWQLKRHVHANLSLEWILQLFRHHVLEPELPKNCDSHIDASLSRQPLVKGERLVRYEVNAVISSWSSCNHILSFYTKSCHAIWNDKKNQTQTCMHPASSRKRTSANSHSYALASEGNWTALLGTFQNIQEIISTKKCTKKKSTK